MPGSSEIGHGLESASCHMPRKTRRSDSNVCIPAGKSTGTLSRVMRSSVHACSENGSNQAVGSTAGRRSPRLGTAGLSAGNAKMSHSSATQGLSGALGDITNVGNGRAQQGYNKHGKQPLAPLAGSHSNIPNRQPASSARSLTGDQAAPMSTLSAAVETNALFAVAVTQLSGATQSVGGNRSSDTLKELQLKVARQVGVQVAQIELVQGNRVFDSADMQRTLGELGIKEGVSLGMLVGSNVASTEDAQMVVEYAPQICSLLFREESTFMCCQNYMNNQTDINSKMRAILIDWLIEVHMKYRLRSESLYLSINLIDRYMTNMPVLRKRLQLVGVVAMFIATKFEEIQPPEIQDFVYITDNAYTKDDILVMECTMLTTLGFHIAVPTAAHFFDRLEEANQCDANHKQLVHYLAELALLEIKMVRFTPSHLVSSALLLSNELLGRDPAWPQVMECSSTHSEASLRPCVDELRALLTAAPAAPLQAVRKKYLLPQYGAVASLPCCSS